MHNVLQSDIKYIWLVDQTSEPDILMADIHRPDIVFSTQERSGLLMREFLWHEVSLSRDVSSGEAGPLRWRYLKQAHMCCRVSQNRLIKFESEYNSTSYRYTISGWGFFLEYENHGSFWEEPLANPLSGFELCRYEIFSFSVQHHALDDSSVTP